MLSFFFPPGGNQERPILEGAPIKETKHIIECQRKSHNRTRVTPNTEHQQCPPFCKMTNSALVFITASLMIVVLLGQSSCTNAALQDFETDSIERRSAEMAFSDDLAKQWLRQIIAVSAYLQYDFKGRRIFFLDKGIKKYQKH